MKKSLLSVVVLAAISSATAHADGVTVEGNAADIQAVAEYAKATHEMTLVNKADIATNTADIHTNTQTLLTHHQALVSVGREVNDVKGDVSHLQDSVTMQHQALVSAGKEINSIMETNANQQHFIAQNRQDIVTMQGDVAGNAADLKATADKLDKVETVVAGNYTDLKATGDKLDKVETVVAGNYADIQSNASDISKLNRGVEKNSGDIQTVAEYAKSTHDQTLTNKGAISANAANIAATSEVVAGTVKQDAIRNGDKYQSMLHARQEAETQATVTKAIAAIPVVKPVTVADHSKDIAANKADIKATQGAVSKLATQQKIDSVHYGQQIQTLAGNQGVLADAVNTNANVINNNAAASRATQSQADRNTQSISKLNSNFSSLKNQVESDRSEYRGGIATATALAGLPQVNANQKFMVSAAAGTFKDASAIAVGGSANITEHVVVKFGVSDSTEGDAAANVGIGYGF